MMQGLGILIRLRLTIRWNTLVDKWRKVPLIRRLNLGALIGNDGAKTLYHIVSLLLTALKVFFLNLLYVGGLLFLPALLYVGFQLSWDVERLFEPESLTMITAFFMGNYLLMSLIGGVTRQSLLNSKMDTYYAIYLMRMDAGRFALADMTLFLLRVFLGQLPIFLLFGMLLDIPTWLCFLLPVVTLGIKQIFHARKLLETILLRKVDAESREGNCAENREGNCAENRDGNCVENREGNCVESREGNSAESREGNCAESRDGNCAENRRKSRLGKELRGGRILFNVIWILGVLAFLIMQYMSGTRFRATFTMHFYMPVFLVIIVGGVLCTLWICRYQDYRGLYEHIRRQGGFSETDVDLEKMKQESTKQALEQDSEIEAAEENTIDRKWGYDEFHRTFMRRHNKLMTRSANRFTFVILILFGGILVGRLGALLLGADISQYYRGFAEGTMPYMAFILYFVNRGENMTNAMFINCDHAMLAYNFYREPATILAMFRRRLVSLIRVNLRPAAAIALCITTCGFLGAEGFTLMPLVFGATILLLSVFFSLHTLVMYYLLQPFDVESRSTGITYRIVSIITYIVCFYVDDVIKDPVIFCAAAGSFSIIYVLVGLILVKILAPRTFRIR